MREGWRKTGAKEGDVISPGMSLSSLQVGVKLGDEHFDFSYVLSIWCCPQRLELNPKMSSAYWNGVWSECFFLDQADVGFLSLVVPCW